MEAFVCLELKEKHYSSGFQFVFISKASRFSDRDRDLCLESEALE